MRAKATTTQPIRLNAVRPLVRYVDEDQAVIEVHLAFDQPLPPDKSRHAPRKLEAIVEVDSVDGFHDEDRLPLKRHGDAATVRFDLVRPKLWWPASMGEQALYDVKVRVIVDGRFLGERCATIGLASVRRTVQRDERTLMVNGRECPIERVTSIDAKDERGLLPIGGDALVLIRGHWGPDVLYDAADRAGLLIVQTVPIHPEGRFEHDIADEVDRLARHPSLAGWYVGHLGGIRERLAYCLSSLDPSRQIFRELPAA